MDKPQRIATFLTEFEVPWHVRRAFAVAPDPRDWFIVNFGQLTSAFNARAVIARYMLRIHAYSHTVACCQILILQNDTTTCSCSAAQHASKTLGCIGTDVEAMDDAEAQVNVL
jgi:hypothetical protein